MKEQLVSLKTARSAMKQGFILSHPLYLYDENGEILDLKRSFDLTRQTFILDSTTTLAPTQSLLQKWLREVHGINIFMSFKPNIKKWDFIPYFMSMDAKEYIEYNSNYTKQNNKRRFDTYEDALEIGLQEALKLIQK